MSRLNIVIVNFFSEKLVLECIHSINNSNYNDYQITIVDNGSSTNLLVNIDIPKIELIINNSNKGFGHACNTGTMDFKGDYILFLNPDTKVYKETLEESINFMDYNKKISVMGCKQIDDNNNIHRTCARFITLKNYFIKIVYLHKMLPNYFNSYRMIEFDHKSSCEVDHVMGSFYLIRNKTFKELNGFDTDYFVYYEDLDLSKRIRDIGGVIFYNSKIKIYHETGGTSKNIKAIRLFYSLDALIIYTRKHLLPFHYKLVKVSILFFEPLLRLSKSIMSLNQIEIQNIVKAYKKLYRKRLFK